jgi:hypothetical protein
MSLVAEGPLIHGLRAVRLEPAQRLRHRLHDLSGPHDAHVQVRDEGERPPSLAGSRVEHDRAGLRDGDRAGRDDADRLVELVRGDAAGVAQGLALARPRRVEVGGHDQAARGRSALEHLPHGRGTSAAVHRVTPAL